MGSSATVRPNPEPATVHELFVRAARAAPDAEAVTFEGASLTYAELDARAESLAAHLRAAGVGPEAVVGIHLERSLELVVALLGVLKAGGAYLPLDPTYPRARLELMAEGADVSVVLSARALVRRLSPAGADVWALEDLPPEPPLPPAGGPEAGPENLAYVIYTSGSTGVPKGVMVPHRGVVNLVTGLDDLPIGPGEVVLGFAPVAFDASTFEIWGTLLNGGCLALAPAGPLSLEELGAFIRTRGIGTAWLTAPLFHRMVEERPEDLRGLRRLVAGGDALSLPHVLRAGRELPGCRLVNGYGPTETTTFALCHPIPAEGSWAEGRHSVPIGRPIANTECHVLDGGGEPVPVGATGELYLGGAGVARGYLGRPDLTAERFVPNPFSGAGGRLYRTGDLVRALPDGAIEFVGRIDQQVKVRGFRVEPQEVRAHLQAHPEVREAAVVPRWLPSGEVGLVAYVASTGPTPVSPASLRAHLRGRLPAYMLPAAFVVLSELPRSPSGKLDPSALPPPALRDEGRARAAPRDEVEERVARIWEQVLGLEEVGVDEDFFELGGHSLLAMQVVSRVREALGADVALADILVGPTVAALAAAILRAAGEAGGGRGGARGS